VPVAAAFIFFPKLSFLFLFSCASAPRASQVRFPWGSPRAVFRLVAAVSAQSIRRQGPHSLLPLRTKGPQHSRGTISEFEKRSTSDDRAGYRQAVRSMGRRGLKRAVPLLEDAGALIRLAASHEAEAFLPILLRKGRKKFSVTRRTGATNETVSGRWFEAREIVGASNRDRCKPRSDRRSPKPQ